MLQFRKSSLVFSVYLCFSQLGFTDCTNTYLSNSQNGIGSWANLQSWGDVADCIPGGDSDDTANISDSSNSSITSYILNLNYDPNTDGSIKLKNLEFLQRTNIDLYQFNQSNSNYLLFQGALESCSIQTKTLKSRLFIPIHIQGNLAINTLGSSVLEFHDSLITSTDPDVTITKSGTGIWILSKDNTSSFKESSLYINNGILSINEDKNLGDTSNLLFLGSDQNITTFTTGISTFIPAPALPTSTTLDALRQITLNGSKVYFNTDTNHLQIDSKLQGSEGFYKTGSYELILTNSSKSFTGPIVVQAGTLSISNMGSVVSSSQVSVLENAGLNISNATSEVEVKNLSTLKSSSIFLGDQSLLANNDMDLEISGSISGNNGGFAKKGSGTLSLTNNSNSYLGKTSIHDGTLLLDSIAASGTNSFIGCGSVIEFASNGSGRLTILNESISDRDINIDGDAQIQNESILNLEGVVSGSGTLSKYGLGNLILSGSNTHTGETFVYEGILTVNGTSSSPTYVENQARLQGIGKIDALLTNSGTVAPGNSIGTLTVASFNQNGSGTLEIECGFTSCDLLNVTGNATLDGVLEVFGTECGIFRENTSYTILTSSNLTGMFSEIAYNQFYNLVDLEYMGNDVILHISKQLYWPNQPDTYNSTQVFQTINSPNFNATDSFLDVVEQILPLSNPEFSLALEKLSNVCFAGFDLINLNALHTLTTVMQNRIGAVCLNQTCKPYEKCRYLEDEKDLNFWIEPAGFYYHQEKIQSQPEFHSTFGAILTGIEVKPSKNWIFGIAGGYSYDHTNWDLSDAKLKIQGGYLGYYSSFNSNYFFADLSVIAGLLKMDGRRVLSFEHPSDACGNSFFDVAKRGSKGATLDGHFGMGLEVDFYHKKQSKLGLQTYGNIDFVYLYQRAYREYGAGDFGLDVHQRQSNTLRVDAGISILNTYETSKGRCFTQKIFVSGVAERFLNAPDYKSHFVNDAIFFKTRGYKKDIYLIAPGFELSFVKENGDTFTLNYSIELNHNQKNQKFGLRLGFDF